MTMNMNTYRNTFFDLIENAECTSADSLIPTQLWLDQLVTELKRLKAEKRSICFIGNGASQSMAAHFAVDFTKNAGMTALSFDNSAMLTCFHNDFSFETAFAEMLQRYMKNGDALFAISSSGQSRNIVNAARFVAEAYPDSLRVTLSGFRPDNPLRRLGRYNVYLAGDRYGFVESGHAFFLHMILDLFMEPNGEKL
ncbi:SIS domain-containing protein [candidate division KSB1 bacterium]|nr:SIS domain-containing protein [candidate division KSB1 bacterium]